MLWSEFLKGTNCKDTDYNYKVYKSLEEIYMINDSLTKEYIYTIGKQLVDNSPTKEETELENRIKSNIADYESEIAIYERDIDRYECYIDGITTSAMYTAVQKKEYTKDYKYQIKWRKEEIKRMKNKIKSLKYWFLTK